MVRAKAFFGVTTLVLGLIALGLAVIPRAFFNVPPPWPKEPAPQPHQVTEGGKSIEWKGIKVTFGGTTKTIPPPPSPPTPAVSISFATATAVVALLGLGLGVFACWRERSYALAIPGVVLCSLALMWHYVVLGVVVGVAVLILFVILMALGG